MSNLFSNLMVWVIAPALMVYVFWNQYRLKKAAKYVSAADFQTLLRSGQLIDTREPNAFKKAHILGARNFPIAQKETFEASLTSLRKDKPVLLYDYARSQTVNQAILTLKKAGFTEIYVLRDGFESWEGKVK